MSGGTVLAPNPSAFPGRFARAREAAGDVLLATALLWALPLLAGIAAAVSRLLVSSTP